MKIAYIVSTYPPYKGGMGHVAMQFAQKLVQRGHECTIFTPDYNKQEYKTYNDGVSIIRINPILKYGNAGFIPQIYTHLKKFDCIHLHYPFFGGAETVFLYKLLHPKKTLIITYHMDVIGTGIVKIISSIYKQILLKPILSSADTITCSSLDYAKYSHMKKVVQKKGVDIIPFGTDFLGQVKSLSNQNKLLFVGGLDQAHHFKGLSVLLKALKQISTPISLSIVGKGDLMSEYKEQAQKLSWHNISFLSSLSLDELKKAYKTHDYTILPSINAGEAFGLVLIESMASGTPVIASNLAGVRSVLSKNHTGFLIEPNNIESLITTLQSAFSISTKNYQKLSQNSINRVDNYYRWDKIISDLENIYQKK